MADAALSSAGTVAEALPGALERNELRLEYQPVYRLATGELATAEALLRWDSPALGPVAPERFIRLMEENGLILEVGRWVLDRVCAQAAAWRRGGLRAKLSLNVSAQQLEAGDFPQVVGACARRHGCDPAWLEFELTEHMLARDVDRMRSALAGLVGLGATIAIDDFGSGYSSLALLAETDVQVVKLDRSLIAGVHRHPRRGAIVEAVVSLCRTLGLAVTVEGVEEPEQAAFLRRFPSVQVQGFLFGRPRAPSVPPTAYCAHCMADAEASPA